MGIFDFLKKIISDEKIEKIEKEKSEKIAFSDIGHYTENKRKEIEIRENEVIILIKNRINVLTIKLKEKIEILKKVDIESRKVEDKIKVVVEEGRKKYIESLGYLIDNLNNLQENKLEKIILEIDHIFLSFNKSLYVSYERATILIGKEMENIKNELKLFSKEIANIFDENKDIITSFKALSLIKSKFEQFNKVREEIEKINQSIIYTDKQITCKEEENKKTLEDIERIKKNPEYLEHLKRLEDIKSLELNLEKNIHNLKQLIDFKALGNFYHIFDNKMKLVNLYRDDFNKNFQKDDGEEFLNLLNGAKLITNEISDKIKQVRNNKEEILKNKKEDERDMDETQELYLKITRIVLEITNLKNEKSKEEKRLKKLNASKQELTNDIKKEFEKFGFHIT